MLGWTVIKDYYQLDLLGLEMGVDLLIFVSDVVSYAKSQAQLPDSQML